MKKHLLLLLSCSLLVGEASYASKRLRDPGADKSPHESKRHRTQDDCSLAAPHVAQDLMRLINEKPDYIFENTQVYEAVLEACYKKEISGLPKDSMEKVLYTMPFSQKSLHIHDIVCFMFSRVLGLYHPVRPQTLATLQEHEELGDAHARHALAIFYLVGGTDTDGNTHIRNRAKAHALLLKGAHGGHAPSQGELGCLLLNEWEDENGLRGPDASRAFELLTKASEAGYPPAQYHLSRLYAQGWTDNDGTVHKPDMEQEYHWLETCAKQGHTAAQTEQALMCLEKWHAIGDKSIEYYKALAFSLLCKAANTEYAPAQYHLGKLYRTPWVDENGVEHKEDEDKAYTLLNAAAMKGHIPAQDMLLNCLDNGMEISFNGQILTRLQSKQKLLHSWVESGCPHTQYKLAKFYLSDAAHLNGGNYDINYETANRWAMSAASTGHAKAQYIVAWLSLFDWKKCDGTHHLKSNRNRFNYLTQAASQNHKKALEALADMYFEGWDDVNDTFVDEDEDYGIELYKKAAALGSSSSAYFLSSIYMDGDRKNIPLALEYASQAADQNHMLAQYKLGMLYLHGHEDALEPDMDKAIHYLLLSACEDHPEAVDKVKEILKYTRNENNYVPTDFTLSLEIQEQLEKLLPSVQHLIGVTNPHTLHQESMKSEFLHKNLTLVEEDILNLQKILPFVNMDGFMMSDVHVTFAQDQSAVNLSSLKVFDFNNRHYLCAGRKNVEAAKAFLPSVTRAQSHPSLQKCMGGFEFFKEQWDPKDQESQDNCALMLKTLQEMDETLQAVSNRICANIAKRGYWRAFTFLDVEQ